MTETAEVPIKRSPGTARSIRVRYGEDAYLKYKETGELPENYCRAERQESPKPNRFTVSAANTASIKLAAAETFLAKGIISLAKENLLLAIRHARVCMENCSKYFGEMEEPYFHAQRVIDNADGLRERIKAVENA